MTGRLCCFDLITLAFPDDLCAQIVRKIQMYVAFQFDSSLGTFIHFT
jgi:hypothetical protein